MKKLIVLIFICLLPVAVLSQELTIVQGDTVVFKVHQATELTDDRLISQEDLILYTVQAVHASGVVEILGGLSRVETTFPQDGIKRVIIQTSLNDEIGTHKIQAWTDRSIPGQAGEFRNEVAEAFLTVNRKIDDTPTKKLVIELILQ